MKRRYNITLKSTSSETRNEIKDEIKDVCLDYNITNYMDDDLIIIEVNDDVDLVFIFDRIDISSITQLI